MLTTSEASRAAASRRRGTIAPIIPTSFDPHSIAQRRALRAWLLACALALTASPAAARVVLVGVDGATWSMLDPLMAEGALPNFAAMAGAGVTADLDTVEPVNSPTVWTSIATGRSPDVHRIKDFFATALDRPVPTIFERLAAQGVRVGLYEYLKTWPPQTLPGGFVIPGWTRRDETVTPEDVFARAGSVPGYRYSLDGLHNRLDYLENSRRELREKVGQWNALAKAWDLDVGTVTFYAIDSLSHRFWLDAFPEQFEDPPRGPNPAHRGVLREAATGVDASLGEIRAALTPDDVVIVASDHGFEAGDPDNRVWTSSLDGALAEQGLVAGREAFRFVSQFFVVLIRVTPGAFEEREALTEQLAGLLREARSTGGTPLYSVDVMDAIERPPGHERPLLNQLRQWGVRTFARFMFDVELNTPAHAYVLAWPDREALDPLWPDGRVLFAEKERPLSEIAFADDFNGAHHPTAVFLAAGGPIRHQPARGRLSVLDIAPLLAYLADTPIPDDLEGRLPEELFDPAHLAAHPPRSAVAADLPVLPPLEDPAAGGEEALLERLRAMGYVR